MSRSHWAAVGIAWVVAVGSGGGPVSGQVAKLVAPTPKMPAKLTEVAAPAGVKVSQLHPPIAVPLG
jgi:hypothetical protein